MLKADITVQTRGDAYRLDIGRADVKRRGMCTEVAWDPAPRDLAYRRRLRG